MASFSRQQPQKLLIYYGYPSLINSSSGDIDCAALSHFANYDYIVLGAGLQLTADKQHQHQHPDHVATKAILQKLVDTNNNAVKVFGYVNLGNSNNYDLSEIQDYMNAWKKMMNNDGSSSSSSSIIHGIFLDEFGYDFGVTRERQNMAVTYAHSIGLTIVANAFRPDDAFGNVVHEDYNPNGVNTCLGKDDFYLYESYQIRNGQYVSEEEWRSKADALAHYQQKLQFQVLSITTINRGDEYDEEKFYYSWFSALIDGHVATGWGEADFSAIHSVAPFYSRPDILMATMNHHSREPTVGSRRYKRRIANTVAFVDVGHNKRCYGCLELSQMSEDDAKSTLLS